MEYLKYAYFIITHPISVTVFVTVFTYLCYVGVMKLKRWTVKMKPWQQILVKIIFSPFILIALLADFLMKYLAGPVFLWTRPREDETMFTHILSRVAKINQLTINLRQRIPIFVANKFCDLLDKSDLSGDHCHRRSL